MAGGPVSFRSMEEDTRTVAADSKSAIEHKAVFGHAAWLSIAAALLAVAGSVIALPVTCPRNLVPHFKDSLNKATLPD